jgi:hypothetical protein
MTRSVYLGQFTDEVANEIAGELEGAGIPWSYKQAGFLTKVFFMGEWGTRLFVEDARLGEAREIAERVSGRGSKK